MSRRENREREEREEKERKKREKLEKKRENKGNKKEKKSKKKNKKDSNIFVKILKGFLKAIVIILLIIILLLGVFIGWLGFTTNWDFNKMVKKGAKQAALVITGQTQEDLDNLPPIYCLVMGVSVDIDTKLTDTIILCAYYPRTQQASMLSIPRDTFVGSSQSTASGYDKINSLYTRGGPEATVEAVEKLTGIEIPNYLVVDTQSLIKIVDEIGGVDFDVPIDMDYDDDAQDLYIHLSKGYQRIDGDKAEQLLRFRHNNNGTSYPYEYGDNDIGRMKTQRNFISETIKQTVKFKNITKINDIIKIAYDYTETNANMDEVLKYSPAAIDFDVSSIKAETLPGAPAYIGPYNLSFFIANKSQTQELVEEMFNFDTTVSKEDVKIGPENLKVQVLNGCGDEEVTNSVVANLKEAGYKAENAGKTSTTYSTKVINRSLKQEEIVNGLVATLGKGNVYDGKDYTKCDFTIVVGKDYLTPAA
ncbi:MAG: LCP family protein [Clostridia bacterium]|nr:LCP family protein [Clostridia bacterium]